MVNSFKKAIACLLAVLMVAFSVPFTALAADASGFDPDDPSTAHPDLQAQFGALFNYDVDESFDTPTDASGTHDYSGLYGPPVVATFTKNTTTGGINVTKLEQKASLSAAAAAQFEISAIDKVYTTGDYFTLTLKLDNVDKATFISFLLNYSDNIEPAAVWHTGKGNKAVYDMGLASDIPAKATVDFGGDTPITDYSADKFNMDYDEASYNENGSIYCVYVSADGSAQDASGFIADDEDYTFIDPVTGEDNYSYNDTFIVATYLFKITGEFDAQHPITLTPGDPANEMFTQSYEGGSFTASGAEQTNFATYAPLAIAGGDQQFTFFGMNINSGEGCSGGGDVHTHDMTPTAAVAATCTEAGNSAYWYCAGCGKYFSDAEGTTEIAENSWVIDALGHDYVGVPTAPTCTEAGYTTYTWSRCGNSYTEAGDPATGHTPAAAVEENRVEATCLVDGSYDSVVYCSVCGAEISRTPQTITAPGSHDWGEWTEVTPATEESTGLKRRECSRCDAFEEEEIPVLPHTHVPGEAAEEDRVEATCTVDGSYNLVVRCTKCGEIISSTPQTIPATGHKLTPYEAVPATCTEDGTEAYWVCSVCGAMFSDAAGENEISNPIVIPAAGHTPAEAVRENEVAATCTEAGSYDSVVYCSVCNAEISRTTETIAALGHAWSDWTVVTPATKTKKGEEKRTCSRCNAVETREIDSLDIIVTVEAENGTVVCEGKEGAGPYSFKFGDHFVLNATPAEGYQFVSWKINDKVVKEGDTMYDSNAYADVTITPVFAKAQASEYEVVFLDLYKKVAKKVTVASAAELEAAAPTAADMARQGYTFLGWDKELSEITAPCDVTAQYVRDEEAAGYTVTVEGADDVTINGEAVKAKDGIPFDSKVTVVANGAKGFKIGDTVVSTSDTYSFYVGADVTVTAIMNETVAKDNVIDILSVTPVSGSYKYQFLATRTLASGYKLEKVGFVYGKNLADEELVIDKVGQPGAGTNAGQIKVGYNNINNVLETVLQYGLKNGDGTAKARAFMIVSKGGKSEVIYSTIKGWDYVNGAVIDGGIPVIDDGD